MSTLDVGKLEKLLADKNGPEAAAFLKTFLDGLTDAQKGAVYTDFAMIYMKVMNSIDADYKKYLEALVAKLEAVRSAEKKAGEAVKVRQARIALG